MFFTTFPDFPSVISEVHLFRFSTYLVGYAAQRGSAVSLHYQSAERLPYLTLLFALFLISMLHGSYELSKVSELKTPALAVLITWTWS